MRRTRHVVKEDFACFSPFLGTFKKRVLIRRTAQKRKVFNLHVIRTLSFFFRGKSDVYEMRKIFHLIRTLRKEGPI